MDKDMYIGLLEARVRELEIMHEMTLDKMKDNHTDELVKMEREMIDWKSRATDLNHELEKVKAELDKRMTPAEKYAAAKDSKNKNPKPVEPIPPIKKKYNRVDWDLKDKEIKNLLYTLGELTTRQLADHTGIPYKTLHTHLHKLGEIGDIGLERKPQHGKKTMTAHWFSPKRRNHQDNIDSLNGKWSYGRSHKNWYPFF